MSMTKLTMRATVSLLIALATVPVLAAEPGQVKAKPRVDRFGDPLPEGAVMRIGTVRFRHEHAVTGVAWSPDGKVLAANNQLWDAATGKAIRTLQVGPRDGWKHVVWSPDGKTLALVGEHISLWDPATGKRMRTILAPGPTHAAWSPDGKVMATVCWSDEDATIRLWDTATGKQIRAMKRKAPKHRWSTGGPSSPASDDWVCWSPDGKMLASAGSNGMDLWESSGKEIASLGDGRIVCWSPDGTKLVSANYDAVRLLDAATRREIRTWKDGLRDIKAVCWSPDGKTIAAAGGDNAIRLWDARSGKELHVIRGGHCSSFGVNTIAWSPDGKLLASAGYDHTLRLWDPVTGKEAGPAAHPCVVREWFPANIISWSPDSKVLASAADCTIRLWDPLQDKELRALSGHDRCIHFLAWSPDGKTLVSGSGDSTARLWDAATGIELHMLPHSKYSTVYSATWSPDGKVLATADRSIIRLWNIATGSEILAIKGQKNPLGAYWSADGKSLLSFGLHDETIYLWNSATGKEIRHFTFDNYVYRAGWSADGKIFVWVDGTIRLLDPGTGRQIHTLNANSIWPESWSRDGRTLAALGRDAAIQLWDVAAGKEIRTFDHDGSNCYSVAFSPDGRLLASAHHNTTVLIWHVSPVALDGKVDGKLDVLWRQLAANDAASADRAFWQLVSAREKAVRLLDKELRLPPELDAKLVGGYLADLDSSEYRVRAKAASELQRLGTHALPHLRKALAGNPSFEARKRMQRLVAKLETYPGLPLQQWRALAVLERIGSPEAKAILEKLAKGDPHARLTQEARASRARLAK